MKFGQMQGLWGRSHPAVGVRVSRFDLTEHKGASATNRLASYLLSTVRDTGGGRPLVPKSFVSFQ